MYSLRILDTHRKFFKQTCSAQLPLPNLSVWSSTYPSQIYVLKKKKRSKWNYCSPYAWGWDQSLEHTHTLKKTVPSSPHNHQMPVASQQRRVVVVVALGYLSISWCSVDWLDLVQVNTVAMGSWVNGQSCPEDITSPCPLYSLASHFHTVFWAVWIGSVLCLFRALYNR